jgi:TP901 family phage tail tape measure protein
VSLRTVGVRLTADVTGFATRMKAAQESVKGLHKELKDDSTAAFSGKMKTAETSVKGFNKELQNDTAAGFSTKLKSAQESVKGFNKELKDESAQGFTAQMKAAENSAKGLQKELKEDAVGGFSTKLKNAQVSIKGFDQQLKTSSLSTFTTKMKSAQVSVASFHKEMANQASSGKLDGLADKAGMMGIGLAAGFGAAIKAAADFDKQMSAVSAATHANAQDMDALRKAALQAGKDTQFSATGAAEGITELSKAGVSTADVLNGGLTGALSLAAAGQLDVGEAAETAASAMTQFKLSGNQVPHVADLLSAAAGKAQGSVHDLGYALSQSGLVASQMGLSIEDATGTLASFASAGLLGSDAGTSFKTMLLAIQNPTGKTADLMNDLGISAYDASGNFVGIAKFAGILQDKLKGLTPQLRQQALAQMFGNDAVRAGTVLYDQGAQGIQGWIDKTNDAGYAASTASKMTDNLSGDIERLKGSLETAFIEGGSGPSSGLRVLVKAMDGLIGKFLEMPPIVSSTLVVFAGIGAALLLGGAAWVKYRRFVAEAQEQLIATGPAGAKAATALGKLSAVAGKMMVWSAAMEAAAMVLNTIATKSADVDKLTDSVTNLANTGKTVGELNNVFGDNLDNFGKTASFADGASHGLGKFINTTLAGIPVVGDLGAAIGNLSNRLMFGTDAKQSAEDMATLDQSLVQFMDTTHDASKASEVWNQLLSKSGLDTEALAKLLPNAYSALGKLNASAMDAKDGLGAAAQAEKDLKEKAAAAQKALVSQRDAFTDLADAMKAEQDPVFGLLNAQDDLVKAQKAATKAIKDHKKGSAEAASANRDLAQAAVVLQGAVGKVASTFDGKMTPSMVATLKSAGLTKAQIENLATQFKLAKTDADKYAGDYKANTSAPGAVASKKQLEDATGAALDFDGKYAASLSTPGAKEAQTAINNAWNAGKDFDGTYKASLSSPGAPTAEKAAADAWAQAKGFDGTYNAKLSITGDGGVTSKLNDLLIKQRALQTGLSYSSAKSAVQKDLDRNRQGSYDVGGWTGPGDTLEPAGIVHADEFVIKKSSRKKIEAMAPGLLDHMNATGMIPGYAFGRLGHEVRDQRLQDQGPDRGRDDGEDRRVVQEAAASVVDNLQPGSCKRSG